MAPRIGNASIIRGDARQLPLADASVDLICTSPPYFGLRSYQDGGEHYDGQIGSEATPAEFLDALIAATREMVRVLKPSGSIFVNLGDKYNTYAANRGGGTGIQNGLDDRYQKPKSGHGLDAKDYPYKCLIGIPWRYAIRCIDQLGLILRAEIIWAKPNGLPESVTDRVRRSHEQWFHFVKQPRYFSAVDEIREPHARLWDASNGGSYSRATRTDDPLKGNAGTHRGATDYPMPHPLGKLPGSVWTIPTQPLTVPPELGIDHFAAYPLEWPRRIIQGWTPTGICTACGEGRRPVVPERPPIPPDVPRHGGKGLDARGVSQGSPARVNGHRIQAWNAEHPWTITGYTCDCPTPTAPTTPATVLDPFMGTGTTLLAAKTLGRNSIGVDLSADYCRLAEWRTNDPAQLAAALQVEKPPEIPAGQMELW